MHNHPALYTNGEWKLPEHARGTIPAGAGERGLVEAANSGDTEARCPDCGEANPCDTCVVGLVGNG